MAIRIYTGSARPVNDAYEGNPAYEIVERDAADGSLERGYRHIASGDCIGMATMEVSAAREVVLAAARAAVAAETTARQTFITSITDLAVKVKANTATAAEQRTLLVKLARVAVGLLSDMP